MSTLEFQLDIYIYTHKYMYAVCIYIHTHGPEKGHYIRSMEPRNSLTQFSARSAVAASTAKRSEGHTVGHTTPSPDNQHSPNP